MAILLPLCLSLTEAEAQEGADEREGQAPFRVEVDAGQRPGSGPRQ